MIHVIASIKVKTGCLAEFVDIFKSNVPNVLKERGCIAYTPTLDAKTDIPVQELDENKITVIETWQRLADLQAHLTAPHMLVYREKVKELVESVSIKVLKEV